MWVQGVVKVHKGQTRGLTMLLSGRLDSCLAAVRARIWPGRRVHSRVIGTDNLLESHRPPHLWDRPADAGHNEKRKFPLKLIVPVLFEFIVLQVYFFSSTCQIIYSVRMPPWGLFIWELKKQLWPTKVGLSHPNVDGPFLKNFTFTSLIGKSYRTTETLSPLVIGQRWYRLEVLPLQVIFGWVRTPACCEHTNLTKARFNLGLSSSYLQSKCDCWHDPPRETLANI